MRAQRSTPLAVLSPQNLRRGSLCDWRPCRNRHAICDGIARFVSGRAARLGQLECCVVAKALLLLHNQISVTQLARPKSGPPGGP